MRLGAWLVVGVMGGGSLVGPAKLAGKEPPAVVINVLPIVYAEPDTFPRGRPPAITESPEGAGGLCTSNWGCVGSLESLRPRFGFKTVTAEVTQVRMVTSLKIKIWQVEDAGPEVLPHERTHQAINEFYYAMTEEVAEALVRNVLGRKLTVPRKNAGPEIERLLGKIWDELRAEVRRRTYERCEFAQARFDVITSRSNYTMDNADAMAQALAEEEAHWATIKDAKPTAE